MVSQFWSKTGGKRNAESKASQVVNILAVVFALACAVTAMSAMSPPNQPTGGTVVGESAVRTAVPAQGMRSDAVAVYIATFTASATCAFVLEPEARKRTYTATLHSDGTIEWSGPTLNPPAGHNTISSGVLSKDSLSFSIDGERDSQSDRVHGLWDWDDFGGSKFLNISGKGTGVWHGTQVAGAFDGLFEFHDPFGHYCRATDHQFRFVKQ